jgi:hypothetical protein
MDSAIKKDWYDFVQVVITELKESSETNHNDQCDDKRFYVEEPLDYIFEPDHYPPKNDENITSKSDNKEGELNEIKNENKFTYATVVGESNGFLEYEYKNYTYKRNLFSNMIENKHESYLEEDLHLLGDYLNNHLSSLMRGVSLHKWPGVGFGFTLAMQQFGLDNIYFVCDIKPNSPAEYGLRMGDIIIEIDEIDLSSNVHDLHELNKIIEEKESLNLKAIYESKYHLLKRDSRARSDIGCEDIVIVMKKFRAD